MLKLPICPYCGAEFLYTEVRKSNGKTASCPHCKKTFRICRGWKTVLLVLVSLLVIVGMNWMFLALPSINLPFLLMITAIGVTAVWLLIPFTVRYKTL